MNKCQGCKHFNAMKSGDMGLCNEVYLAKLSGLSKCVNKDTDACSLFVAGEYVFEKQKKPCATCKHLMYSDCYCECELSVSVVTPSYTCDRWEVKNEL